MKKYLVWTLLALVSPAFATNILTISGKLTSITDDLYIIEGQGMLYYLKRKKVPEPFANLLTKTETPVTVMIPMEAVQQIKTADKR